MRLRARACACALAVKHFPCSCGSFKALGPAPQHYHMNLDSTVDDVKKFGVSQLQTVHTQRRIYLLNHSFPQLC